MSEMKILNSIDSIGLEVTGMIHIMAKNYTLLMAETIKLQGENKALKEENEKLKESPTQG